MSKKHHNYLERLQNMDQRQSLSAWGWCVSYLSFFCYLAVCLVTSLVMRVVHRGEYSGIDSDFMKYSDAFGFWQLTGNWHKSQEAVFFRRMEISSPSLEIGLCRGDISALHFEGRHFDLGSEYLYFTGIKASKKYDLWGQVYSDELTKLALRDGSISSIAMVHVIDHVANVEEAFSELSRVLRPGGRLYFSGMSDKVLHPNPAYRLKRVFSRRKAAQMLDEFSRRKELFNFLGEPEWRELLSRHGLDLVEYVPFRGGPVAYIQYFLHFVLFHARCFEGTFFREGVFRPVFERAFRWFYVSIGYPGYLAVKEGRMKWGMDFCITAVRRT